VNHLTKLAQSLGKQEWFAELGKKVVPIDLALQKRTGGRISFLRVAGLPYLVLTATGRKSGQPRSVPLLYVPHGDDYLVVASNWGQKRHPAWSANLLSNPDAVVQAGGQDVPVRARQVVGEERDRLWRDVITQTWPAYDDYAERAEGREIRVFALSPQNGS
jgi:deazaflavin-dependent oxidoreductase (nitroreductase family)